MEDQVEKNKEKEVSFHAEVVVFILGPGTTTWKIIPFRK